MENRKPFMLKGPRNNRLAKPWFWRQFRRDVFMMEAFELRLEREAAQRKRARLKARERYARLKRERAAACLGGGCPALREAAPLLGPSSIKPNP